MRAGSIPGPGNERPRNEHIMKRQMVAFVRRYHDALQEHLQRGPRALAQPARQLGRQAVALGLETLDLARIHKTALEGMTNPRGSSAAKVRMAKRADAFFAEAVTPIEKTHRAGVNAAAQLVRKSKALHRRTVQLASARGHLRKGIVRRHAAEATLQTRRRHYAKLLGKSRHLQKHLQRLAHGILSAQENDRKKLSHELRDEIAQTLLAINVGLLRLKKGAARHTEGLAKEIASTQRLVRRSAHTIDRFARTVRRSK
jgi:signal transduction histidine kinase